MKPSTSSARDHTWLANPRKLNISCNLANIAKKTEVVEECGNADGIPNTETRTVPHANRPYTYFSLQLGCLWKEDSHSLYVRTDKDSYHISLAYLPEMSEDKMRQIERDLKNVLDMWIGQRHKPMWRPWDTDIFSRKHCMFSKGGVWFSAPITDSTIEQIIDDVYIQEAWLQTPTRDNSTESLRTEVSTESCETLTEDDLLDKLESLADQLVQFHIRAALRLGEAMERAKELPVIAMENVRTTAIEVPLTHCKVRTPGELLDLLEYFWQRLVFHHGVFYLRPIDEVRLHDCSSWHVTIEDQPLTVQETGLF